MNMTHLDLIYGLGVRKSSLIFNDFICSCKNNTNKPLQIINKHLQLVQPN